MGPRSNASAVARAAVVVGALGVASLVACGLSVTATGGADDAADGAGPTPTGTTTATLDANAGDGGSQQGDCDGGDICNGTCTDTTSDPENCGRCANPCPAGDTCDKGICQVLCINDKQNCDGTCVDLLTDVNHCKTCAIKCQDADAGVCSNGVCQAKCDLPFTNCPVDGGAGYCADLTTDHDNCDKCGVTCGATEVCTGGTCTSLCATGIAVGNIYGPAASPTMVGCVGKVAFKDRASLCTGGKTVCSPEQWVARYGGVAPKYNYWTNAVMGYTGYANGACAAVENGGNDCDPSNGGYGGGYGGNSNSDPMHVCAANTDGVGNRCYWDQCGLGYNNTKTNQWFGGCVGDTTAGTLCCAP